MGGRAVQQHAESSALGESRSRSTGPPTPGHHCSPQKFLDLIRRGWGSALRFTPMIGLVASWLELPSPQQLGYCWKELDGS